MWFFFRAQLLPVFPQNEGLQSRSVAAGDQSLRHGIPFPAGFDSICLWNRMSIAFLKMSIDRNGIVADDYLNKPSPVALSFCLNLTMKDCRKAICRFV